MSTTAKISQFLRWRDWGPGRLSVFWGLTLYIALAYHLGFSRYILVFLVYLPFAAAQAILGYVINEWGDRSLDRRLFKHNAFNGMTYLERILSLALVLVAAMVTGLPFLPRPGFLMLWLTWALLAAGYSLEPFRLKVHGLVGFLALLAAEWFLPVLITFAVFEVQGGIDMWVLAAALTISGAARELDRSSHNRLHSLTCKGMFTAEISAEKLQLLSRLTRIGEKIGVGLVIGLVLLRLDPTNQSLALELRLVLGSAYILWLLMAWRIGWRRSHDEAEQDSGPSTVGEEGSQLHTTFLAFAVPIVCGLACALSAPEYGLILGLFLVWKLVAGRPDFTRPLSQIRIWAGK